MTIYLAACLEGISLADDTSASSKLIWAANSYSGELALRLDALGLQCRVVVDERSNVGSEILIRDEALARMVDSHTVNASTLDLAMNALIRIRRLQALVAVPPYRRLPIRSK